MGRIYKITNKVNKKFYVGQTKQSLADRFYDHQYTSIKTQKRHPLYDSIRKFGIDNFEVSLLEECDDADMNTREIYWISTLHPPYNITKGGTGGDTFSNRSVDSKNITRQRLSESAKKKVQDPEYIRKLSVAGKRLAQDPTYISKLSEAGKRLANNPEYIRRVSDGVRIAIQGKREIWSECKKGRKNGRWLGEIEMYYPDGTLCKIYESAVECRKDTGMVAHNIRKMATTQLPRQSGKYKGYVFKWKQR